MTGSSLASWKLGLVAMAMATLYTSVAGQGTGNWFKEVHPKLTSWRCTLKDGCKARDTSVVLDQKFRYMHIRGTTTKCTDNSDQITNKYCSDSETCFNNCVYEGVNYTMSGVQTENAGQKNSTLTLRVIAPYDRFVNPRVYLLDETEMEYEKIMLGPGTEFTYDVDMSKTHCGIQSAIYFDQMDLDGGKNQYFDGGAFFGGGFCDSQCFVRDIANGQVNVNKTGSCCAELDLYEGNQEWFSLASHPCKFTGNYFACTGIQCNHTTDGGVCSKRDCHFDNIDRIPTSYFGMGGTINTKRPMTVITQFLTQEDYNKVIAPGHNTSSNSGSDLVSMRRYYLQDGKFFTRGLNTAGQRIYMEVTDKGCLTNGMALAGGMAASGRYMQRGMVLTFSLFRGFNLTYWLHNLGAYQCRTHGPQNLQRQW